MTTEIDAADSTSGKKNAERSACWIQRGIRPCSARARTRAIVSWRVTAKTMNSSVLPKAVRIDVSVASSR